MLLDIGMLEDTSFPIYGMSAALHIHERHAPGGDSFLGVGSLVFVQPGHPFPILGDKYPFKFPRHPLGRLMGIL